MESRDALSIGDQETAMRGGSALVTCALLLALAQPISFAANDAPPSLAASKPGARHGVGDSRQLPGLFVPNEGQIANADVRFSMTSGSLQFGFAERAVLISITDRQGHGALVRATFEGANPVVPEGHDVTPQRNNYFLGADASRWRTDVPTFRSIVFRNLYPGIDLRYRASETGAKYEFDLAAGADPGQIRVAYEGISGLDLASSGELTVRTAAGALHDTAPIAIQHGTSVRCEFALHRSQSVGFTCTGQDSARPFQIDPLLFATYLGGSRDDEARATALDAAGSVYVAGRTGSTDFPTTPGAYDRTYNAGMSDAFVAKFDGAGSRLVYATFVGGSDWDGVFALAVDPSGEVFAGGQTWSSDFPTTPGALSRVRNGSEDAFLLKLGAAGDVLVYSTLLGGSVVEAIYGIVLDASGRAYVTGETASPDFPTTPGAFSRVFGGGILFDAFVAAFDATGGSLGFSTYLGGSGADTAWAIARDSAGDVFVTGLTTSSDFPATVGAFSSSRQGASDAFVAKLDPTGSALGYATYLGGIGGMFAGDVGAAISVDTTGDAYVAGYTNAFDFPTTAGAWDTTCGTDGTCDFDGFQPYPDAFVAKVNASGSGLAYSTFLGGESEDVLLGLAIDGRDQAIVTGYTRSVSFPVTPLADNATYLGGLYDAFVTKLNASGSGLVYSTYLGGSGTDQAYGMALDPTGTAYVVGVTNSTDFPATPAAFDTSCGTDGMCDFDGSQTYTDAFVAQVSLAYPLTLATSPPGLQVQIDGTPVTTPYVFACEPATNHTVLAPLVQNSSSTRYIFRSWSDGGGSSHTISCVAPATVTATYDPTDYRIAVATVPPGLQVLVDGNTQTATYAFWCNVSSGHPIGAPSPQLVGSTRYIFGSWSDGGPQAHSITCNAPATYTASFAVEHQVTIDAVPTACMVVVDGTTYAPPVQFWWSDGSTHALNVPSPQGGGGTRLVFLSWSDGGPQSRVVTVIAPTTYTAYCGVQHNVTVQTVPAGLIIAVNASPFPSPYSFWCDAGSSNVLDVVSPQGSGPTRNVFASWSDGGAQAHSIVCSGPVTYVATFTTEHETNLTTLPSGLMLLVEGVSHIGPYMFWCEEGRSYTLDAPSPQGSGGTQNVFQSWSDGGASQHSIPCIQPRNYTATFDTEHLVTITTNPANLMIDVDAASGPAPVTNWWIEGSSHRIDTPSPQVSGGTRATFVTWSDGGAQAHNVTVTGPTTITATFRVEHLVTLDSIPSGLNVTVDGTPYPTPTVLWLADGSAWTIGITAPQTGGAGIRYVWGASSGWSDGGAQTHGIVVNGPLTLIANLETEYFLDLRSAHGTPWCDRNPSPCWYPKGVNASFGIDTIVPGSVDTQYVYQGWTGDQNFDANQLFIRIRMDGPKTETAQWVTQYYLHVIANPGTATGEDWYNAGVQASFVVSATDVVGPDGKRLRFAGWRYDFNGTGPSGTILMDGPKTVIAQWAEIPFLETAWFLFVLPAIAAILILIFLIWRRRRKKKGQDAEAAEGGTRPDEPTRSSELEEELDLHTGA